MNKSMMALLTLLVVGTASEVLAAGSEHAGHGAAGHGSAVAHTHQTVQVGGLSGTFHFNAPDKPVYTCTMHPEVTSPKAGTCPKCKMDLTKQTHLLGMTLTDAAKKPIMDAKVHFMVKDAHGMTQEMTLKPAGNMHHGAFALMAGKQTLTAHVTRGAGKPVTMSTTYVVK